MGLITIDLYFYSSLFIISIILLIKQITKSSQKSSTITSCKLPPGPWQLPIIGSLHHLLSVNGGSLPHHKLAQLAKEHGPLMYLKLGQFSTIVVSSREVAKEIFKTHDVCVSDRPSIASADAVTYGAKEVIFGRYGDNWRQLKKICVLELLSQKRVQSFKSIRENEVFNLMLTVQNHYSSSSPVNITEELYSLANNVITRAVIGDRCKNQKRFLEVVEEVVELVTGFDLADLFPSLTWLTWLAGNTRKIKKNQRELDEFLDAILRDHEDERHTETDKDLVDVLLRIKDEDGDLHSPLTREGIKAVMFDILAAGSDTSWNVMEWVMSELMKNPEVMKKVQLELREVLQGKTKVNEEDLSGLKYLKLVIKETLRMHPPLTLLLPRECREAFEIMGYHIPVGTRVLVNAWALARDPEYWDEPLVFKPERFEGSGINYNGHCFEYIPFGAGRRMCPGMAFGLATIEFALAQLLYHFDWKLPNGLQPQDLDMCESFGVTARRTSSLLLQPIPRIPCSSI
ncbi:premnaspirodiene oxygenase-like [Dioscorea cayenensis subsp. rotundata]|uniref:Premnaspirodiene oxygenase-like n=1 Tax=Dioscorea cayennensis subsp. rotundata TaxID=55577 RepID=A0AB40CLI6_DIOCR|nr:premnaspirodiene oxygenase-like [Dioscorea cayenensis subsp. rotundata]